MTEVTFDPTRRESERESFSQYIMRVLNFARRPSTYIPHHSLQTPLLGNSTLAETACRELGQQGCILRFVVENSFVAYLDSCVDIIFVP